jgi:hypothetical protein
MDGGSARDLRAEAGSSGSGAQLTGLVAAAHSPDARTTAPISDLSCVDILEGRWQFLWV